MTEPINPIAADVLEAAVLAAVKLKGIGTLSIDFRGFQALRDLVIWPQPRSDAPEYEGFGEMLYNACAEPFGFTGPWSGAGREDKRRKYDAAALNFLTRLNPTAAAALDRDYIAGIIARGLGGDVSDPSVEEQDIADEVIAHVVARLTERRP